MPYKRFRKTVFKKVRGSWKKQHTYKTAKRAKDAMKRMRKEEERKKAKEAGK